MKVPYIQGVFTRPMWCDHCREVRNHFVQFVKAREYKDNPGVIWIYALHSCEECDREYYMEDGELRLLQISDVHVVSILFSDWEFFLQNDYY